MIAPRCDGARVAPRDSWVLRVKPGGLRSTASHSGSSKSGRRWNAALPKNGSWSQCAEGWLSKLSMNRAPSPHPSPPMGERVPEGRVRGILRGSWPQCAIWSAPVLFVPYTQFQSQRDCVCQPRAARSKLPWVGLLALMLISAGTISACELCAIYSASSARGESSAGFLFTLSEQFVAFRTTQFEGEEVKVARADYLDSSITHLVPGYNFSPRFGVGLSLPLVYHSFQRSDLRYSLAGPPVLTTEKADEFGLGDIALIGRWTV